MGELEVGVVQGARDLAAEGGGSHSGVGRGRGGVGRAIGCGQVVKCILTKCLAWCKRRLVGLLTVSAVGSFGQGAEDG